MKRTLVFASLVISLFAMLPMPPAVAVPSGCTITATITHVDPNMRANASASCTVSNNDRLKITAGIVNDNTGVVKALEQQVCGWGADNCSEYAVFNCANNGQYYTGTAVLYYQPSGSTSWFKIGDDASATKRCL